MSTDTPSDGGNWRVTEISRRLMWLHSFVKQAIDHTHQRLDDLKERYHSEESSQAKESWEELWRKARRWLDEAEQVRARLITFAHEASVKIKQVMNNPQHTSLVDSIREMFQTVNALISEVKEKCLTAVGKGTYEEITQAVGTTETDTETETHEESQEVEEFQEMQNDLEEIQDMIDTDDDEEFRLQ